MKSSLPSMLRVRSLQKSYGARQVVHDVSLDVASGEVVGLLGPNGAGKTTSFYMIVGLVPSEGGEITLDDQSISGLPIHRRAELGLSYLPQEASVFRKLSVEEIFVPFSNYKKSKASHYPAVKSSSASIR